MAVWKRWIRHQTSALLRQPRQPFLNSGCNGITRGFHGRTEKSAAWTKTCGKVTGVDLLHAPRIVEVTKAHQHRQPAQRDIGACRHAAEPSQRLAFERAERGRQIEF